MEKKRNRGRGLTQKNEKQSERKKKQIARKEFFVSSSSLPLEPRAPSFFPFLVGLLDVLSDLFLSQAVFASATVPSTLSPVRILPSQPYDREVFLPGFYQSSTLLSEGKEDEEEAAGWRETYIRTGAVYTWFVCSSFFLFGRLSCYVVAGMLLKSDEHRMETVELSFSLFFFFFFVCLFFFYLELSPTKK